MSELLDLTPTDLELIEKLKVFLQQHYAKKRHHVATVLKCCNGQEYFALHLDIQGFDICAEPIALSNALLKGEVEFELIVAILQTDEGQVVVNPCGNCRQMFLQYAPDIHVVLMTKQGLKKAVAGDLLPYPY